MSDVRKRKRWGPEEEQKLEAFLMEKGPTPWHSELARLYKRDHDLERSFATLREHVVRIRRRLWPERFESEQERDLKLQMNRPSPDPLDLRFEATRAMLRALKPLDLADRVAVLRAVRTLCDLPQELAQEQVSIAAPVLDTAALKKLVDQKQRGEAELDEVIRITEEAGGYEPELSTRVDAPTTSRHPDMEER
jgi:hypothetical protein